MVIFPKSIEKTPSKKSWWQRLCTFILFSSLFIAACAGGLVWISYKLLQEPVQLDLVMMVTGATLFLYNLDALLPYKFHQKGPLSEKKQWIVQHRKALIFLAVAGGAVAGVLFLLEGPWHRIWFWLHLALISLLYSWPFIKRGERRIPLRELPLLKVFLIAYVWASVTAGLPLLRLELPVLESESLFLFGSRFFFIFALTLMFDIRDVQKDKLTNTLTFPGWVGVGATKAVSVTALTAFAVLVILFTSGNTQAALLLSAVASVAVVLLANERRSEYYFSVWADGMMLLQFLLLWLFLDLLPFIF